MKKIIFCCLMTAASIATAAEVMPWEKPENIQEEVEAAVRVASAQLNGKDLEWLRLESTLSAPKRPTAALVSLPDGSVVKLYPGTKIGSNAGVVTKIASDQLEIREMVPVCGSGDMVERVTIMKLGRNVSAGKTVKFKRLGAIYICAGQ